MTNLILCALICCIPLPKPLSSRTRFVAESHGLLGGKDAEAFAELGHSVGG